EVVAAGTPLKQFHAADFDHAVALLPFQAGGFGIKDDLAHGLPQLLPALARTRMASSRASWSTRSLSGSPEWPFTQRQSMRCRCVAACSRSHRSRFLTASPPAVFQLRRTQPGIHSVMPWRTYCESVCRVISQGSINASSPEIAAISSMRLLVVWASPPVTSRSWPL